MPTATELRRHPENNRLLTELLATKHHLLRRQARKHAQLDADVDEALQSAYAIFLEKYRPPTDPLPWLMTTIKREGWRLAKRSARKRELAITAVPRTDGKGTVDLSDAFLDPDSDPCEAVESAELLRQRRRLIAGLKPDQRVALIMFALGYSYEEIASRRNWTRTKTNRVLAKGRTALRGQLDFARDG